MTGPKATALESFHPNLGDDTICSYFDATNKETRKYFVNCWDNCFRIDRFVSHFEHSGGTMMTALLPSEISDLKTFKRMWRKFRERLFRKYRWSTFGIIDRYYSANGKKTGQLHAHLWLVIPEWVTADDIKGCVSDDFRAMWEATHDDTHTSPRRQLKRPTD